MSIKIKPETERLVHEEIQKGNFNSVDEIIIEGVQARRKKKVSAPIGAYRRTTLSEFLINSPLAGADLKIDRDKDSGRPIQL